MKLILFDVDGTLIDSQAIIHEAMRYAFTNFGYEAPSARVTRSIIGLTLDQAIAKILDREIDREIDCEIVAMANEYRAGYLQLLNGDALRCRAYDGIAAAIKRLSDNEDILLGLVTGKSRAGVERMLASSEFRGHFIATRCADDCPSKPHPAMVLECCEETGIRPSDALVVGDTAFDAEMAKAAGAAMIGVSWGYHPARKLLASGAAMVAGTVGELERSVNKWVAGDAGWRLETAVTGRIQAVSCHA